MRTRGRRLRCVLLAWLAALLLTVASAPAAVAHTELVGTDPAGEQLLQAPPDAVVLSFNEPVGATAEGMQLIAPSGAAVPVDVLAVDTTVELTPGTALQEEGTYLVAWRVTSADSHPISGSFTFSLGTPSEPPAAVGVTAAAPAVVMAHYGAQTLVYLGAFTAAGLVVFDLLLLTTRPGTAPRARRRVHAVARLGAAVAVSGAVLSVPATALWQEGAGPEALADGALWRGALGSDTALAAGLTGLGVLTAVVAGTRATGRHGPGPARWVALGGVVLAAVSLLVTGHTRGVGPGWLVLTADAVHVAAGLTWAGGILGLLVVLGRSSDVPQHDAVRTLERFSTAAAWVVAALVLAGLLLGWRVLGSAQALVTTGYGQLLLIKAAVVTGAIAVAAWNRYVLSPRLLARPHSGARADLHATLQTEGALLVLILVITGVLTSLTP